MNKFLLSIVLLALFSCGSEKSEKESNTDSINTQFANPLYDGADPWMMKKDGLYYTVRASEGGMVVTESRFMTKPEKEVQVFTLPTEGWNIANIWAPEIHYIFGKWCIYYAAAKKDGSPFIYQRTGVLVADNPLGPYQDKGVLYTGDNYEHQTEENNIWAIDMTIFEHDGINYAVWSGWEQQEPTDKTNQLLYIAKMTSPWEIGERHLISTPDQEWEMGDNIELQEGPSALYSESKSFIVYSTRGSWTPYYNLGYIELTGDNPLEASSWKKSKSSVFQQYGKTYGVGHASFITSPDGKENWIYYHAKKGTEPGWDRWIFLQKFTFDKDGYPNFGKPLQPGERLDRPSGEVDIEKRLQ